MKLAPTFSSLKRTHFGTRAAAVGLLLVVVGTAACSGAASLVSPSAAPTTAPASSTLKAAAPQPAAVPAAAGAAVAAAGVPAASPASDAAAQRSSAVAPANASSNPLPDTSAQILDRMVIRTAQLTVEVTDMEQALAQVRQIAEHAGGFVSASNTRVEKVNDQDRTVADLTLQVRSTSADEALSQLRALGKVTTEASGSQDVTEEYVDLDSNLRNLQATESAILKLMDRATQIQDVLALQRELTNVRAQIERIQGRKTYLERRTDMATITVALRLPAASTPQVIGGGAWDPFAVALRGWQASLALLRGAAEVVIVVAAFSWWLVPFVAFGVYVWQHRRRPAPTAATAAGTAAEA